MSEKPYRCRGSFKIGTACANQDLPEGVASCQKCTDANYTVEAKEAAVAAEIERTKDLPADRVKRSQSIKLEQ
jgi:hypothetical protein